MNKQYAIFDMDGTLVDSMVFWQQLAGEYLHSRGIAAIEPDILERIKPMTMSESAALFQQEYHLRGDVESEMNAMMEDHYRYDIPLKPGVREYLEQLCRSGVRMCVASATAESLMDACLNRLGILDCFDFLLSCETAGAGKHSPRVYQEAAKRLCAQPEQIAVYEDALYAIRTAKDAGFYVIGVWDESTALHWNEIREASDETIVDWKEYCL